MKRLACVQLAVIVCALAIFIPSLLASDLVGALFNVLLAGAFVGVVGLSVDHFYCESFGRELVLSSLVLLIGCAFLASVHPMFRSAVYIGFIAMLVVLVVLQVRILLKKNPSFSIVEVRYMLLAQLTVNFGSLALCAAFLK